MNPQPDRDLHISLLVLAGVIAFACVGLASDANWPKLLRVSAAFTVYAAALLRMTRRGITGNSPFVVAGALAGLASGVVRPEFDAALVSVSVIGGVALALAHRFGLARWRSLHPGHAARSLP